MAFDLIPAAPILEGDILSPGDWREVDDLYGVGDFVTRDGTDIHKVVELAGQKADTGTFLCVVAPQSEPGEPPWIEVGETEVNLTRRYSPVEYRPR